MEFLLSKLKAFGLIAGRFPPLTPAVGGLALILIALAAHSYDSYIRWLEYEKRGNWRAEATLDFSVCGRRQIVFCPIVSRGHHVTLTMDMPPEGDLTHYAGRTQLATEEILRRFLAGREFTFSWQIAREKEPVARGTFHPSDLDVWVTEDRVVCRPHAWGTAELRAGQEYRLIAEVEQACPAVNEWNPILEVRTWGSLKGHPLAAWRLRHTLLFCAVGGVFLLMAYVRWTYDRRRTAPKTVQEQSS